MGFIKIGDEQSIDDIFDDNGKEQFCPNCGKKLTVIAVDDSENKFVCADCDISDEDKTLKN